MQVTIELPEEAFQIADSLAKHESRSLSSVVADFILRRPRTRVVPLIPPHFDGLEATSGWVLPVVEGRPFTSEDVERVEQEDDFR